ncbi:MAG: hypothetical protein ACYC49_10905 [Ignavibacteriaceae bacterium]
MKKILLLVLLFSTNYFPQTLTSTKQLLLENSIIKNQPDSVPRQISFTSSTYGKKNAGLAILLSAILPGMGELYADSYSSGKYFTVADGALWGIYFGMNTYGSWLQDRYKAYAVTTGGVNAQGKGDSYYATIGDYSNIDQYNNTQVLSGTYNQMYGAQYYWNWQTDNQRKTYRNMWYSSEQAKNNLRFVVGGLILNRIASAINAARLVALFNKRQADETSWNFSVDFSNPTGLSSNLNFNFQTSF